MACNTVKHNLIMRSESPNIFFKEKAHKSYYYKNIQNASDFLINISCILSLKMPCTSHFKWPGPVQKPNGHEKLKLMHSHRLNVQVM